MDKHQKKIEQIGVANRAAKEANEITKGLMKNREDRKKTKDFITNERNITINKEN